MRWLPLARSLALRYRPANDAADDVLQVASLGLVKAIDGFDPDRGVAFTSYAVPTILGEIRRYFRDRTWVMRVPRSLQELSLRVDRATAELADKLCRQPSISEIAGVVEAEPEDVLEALRAAGARRPLSLDAPTCRSEDADTLGQHASVMEDGFDRVEQHTTLQAVLATATARERELLRMRFQQNMSQAEIAAVVGVSQMQISRILRRTLQRLYSVAHAGGAAVR